jgi:hypothetical protein
MKKSPSTSDLLYQARGYAVPGCAVKVFSLHGWV